MSAVSPPDAAGMAKKPEWAPRIWQGCSFSAWMRLLILNRFAVHWSRLYIACIITCLSIMNSVLGMVQSLIFGRAIRKTELKEPPIFILGHWRTGTTWLHDLIIQDSRFGYPTTYECFEPHHFLLTEGFFTRFFSFLLPKERPMDHVKTGFDRPQEDEFALCLLGEPSPYTAIAFPNNPPRNQEYLDLESVPASSLDRWKQSLTRFLKSVAYKSGKRIVLKSPPHTARIKVLKEMFPGALFVHIVRDPYVVYASTMNLWRTLHNVQGFQVPQYRGLEEKVFSEFTQIYARLEEGKKRLPPEQFFELRYEDLVHDPVATLRCLYEHFGLGGWNEMHPRLEKFLAELRGYETNKYQLSEAQMQEIDRRWGNVIRRYGYDRADAPIERSPEAVASAAAGV